MPFIIKVLHIAYLELRVFLKINQIFKKFTNNRLESLCQKNVCTFYKVLVIYFYLPVRNDCKFLKKKRINQCNCGLGGKVEYLFNLIEFYRKLKYICFFFFFFEESYFYVHTLAGCLLPFLVSLVNGYLCIFNFLLLLC